MSKSFEVKLLEGGRKERNVAHKNRENDSSRGVAKSKIYIFYSRF
jgi:hypothetical protein